MKKIIQPNRIMGWIATFEKGVFATAFLGLTLAICAQVVCRKLSIVGFTWLDEISRYLLASTTFLAAAIAVSEKLHPSVELLNRFLSARAVGLIHRIGAGICAVLCGYVGFYAYQYMIKVKSVGTVTSNLRWPIWIIYMIFVLGLLGMVLRWVLLIFEKKPAPPAHEEGGDS